MRLQKSIELKGVEIKGDANQFEGYASIFNGNDSYNDTILPGAFASAIKKGVPLMFFNHDWSEIPIGKWTKLEEDDKGLRVVGELTPGNPHAESVLAALKHGTLNGLSIGFSLSKDGYDEKEDGGRTIKEIDRLFEISVVTFPADEAARIEAVKSAAIGAIETVRDFERFLRDAGGFSRSQAAALCAKAKEFVSDQGDPDVEAKTQEIKERIERIKTKLERNEK